jgi:predicted Zn-dependent protease
MVGCAVNPVTGKKEFMLISESAEIQLGKNVDQGIRQQYGIYNDPNLNAYVARMGNRMAPHTHRSHLKYHFAILDTPVQNAFAAPGGYIYITRGLLAMMNNEAELACVLGHELGHVNARHTARTMSRSMLFNLGLILAGELSEDIRKFSPFLQIATQLLFLKYSRSDEYQADSLGVQYARKINYQPQAMITFFNSLQRLTQMKGGYSLPNFLSTHPLTPRRISEVKEMLLPTDQQLAVNHGSYVNRVNGLVYGNNPRQGYVEQNAFYHPDMRFMFKIPSNWKVQNTPQRVILGPADGKAAIILSAQKSGQNLDAFSQGMLSKVENSTILNRRFTRINALQAYDTLFNMVSSSQTQTQQRIGGRLTCIRKGDMIYSFTSLAPESIFSGYNKAFAYTIGSFRQLSSPRHLKRQPMRVRLRRAPRAETLKSYLQRNRISEKLWPDIQLINMLDLNSTLKPNQLIKLIL